MRRKNKIRNPQAYEKACRKEKQIAAAREAATINRIIELVITDEYKGASLEDIAHQLRVSGALGERDRIKRIGDEYSAVAEEALRAGLRTGTICTASMKPRGVRVFCPRPPAVHPKLARKYEGVKYPETLMVLSDNEGWQLPTGSLKHLRGTGLQLLVDVA